MSKKSFNYNDLVSVFDKYIDGRSYYKWCKLLDIIVDDKSYTSYEVVTGEGDRNTKNIKFKVKIVGESFDVYDFNATIKEVNDGDIFLASDINNIFIIDTNRMKKIYENSTNKINFVIKNGTIEGNRDMKLDELFK